MARKVQPKNDFAIRDEGSIVILVPLTEAARDFVDEHAPEDAQWFGGGLVVEHRYINDPWLTGINEAGLTVNR